MTISQTVIYDIRWPTNSTNLHYFYSFFGVVDLDWHYNLVLCGLLKILITYLKNSSDMFQFDFNIQRANCLESTLCPRSKPTSRKGKQCRMDGASNWRVPYKEDREWHRSTSIKSGHAYSLHDNWSPRTHEWVVHGRVACKRVGCYKTATWMIELITTASQMCCPEKKIQRHK